MDLPTEMRVEILSPEKVVFRGQAKSLGLPGKLGYMTVLPGHTPMIAELGIGTIELSDATASKSIYFIASGFLEIVDGNARVLVDVVEKPEEIDAERARKSEKRAKDRLASSDLGTDYTRANAALKRAQARVTLAAK